MTVSSGRSPDAGRIDRSRPLRLLTVFFVLPVLLYLAGFVAITYPVIRQFSSYPFCDRADGLQNLWNLWWVNRAVTELHTSPWFTRDLHFPGGTTLVAHTLNPFNGFVAVPLLRFLTLTETYNTIVVLSFVLAGVTAFWLAFTETRSFPGALVAGWIFTFSGYHFAHVEGHLQLVSLEWIPLFLLSWRRLVSRRTATAGVFAALALFLVILCDYYYFAFCVLAGGLILGASCVTRGSQTVKAFAATMALPLASFAVVTLMTSGILVLALLHTAYGDGLKGAHRAADFSLDLAGLVVPGSYWRFRELTRPYWSRLRLNRNEASAHLGFVVTAIIVYTWRRRRQASEVTTWTSLYLIFFALSLGPVVHVLGHKVRALPAPYKAVQLLVPPLAFSGCPVRMAVMCTLAAATLCAIGVPLLFRRNAWLGGVALLGILTELLPAPVVTSNLPVPAWVDVLRAQPERAGFMDRLTNAGLSLYYQTVHGKPIAEGYIARIPLSVNALDREMVDIYERGEFRALCERFQVKYFLLPLAASVPGAAPGGEVLYADGELKLIATGPPGRCE